jgi:hypothetical protein
VFRPCTQRYLKNKLCSAPSPSNKESQKEYQSYQLELQSSLEEFWNKILPQINKALGLNTVQKYICKDLKEMSVIDILYYNEIQMFLKLETTSSSIDLNLEDGYPNIDQWI